MKKQSLRILLVALVLLAISPFAEAIIPTAIKADAAYTYPAYFEVTKAKKTDDGVPVALYHTEPSRSSPAYKIQVGSRLTVVDSVKNSSGNIWYKFKRSGGYRWIYADYVSYRGTITEYSKPVLMETIGDGKYWSQPWSTDTSAYTTPGYFYDGKVLKISRKINRNGTIWYKVYNEEKFIHTKYVKAHTCSGYCTQPYGYTSIDSTNHQYKYDDMKCSNSDCPYYYSKTVKTVTEKHSWDSGTVTKKPTCTAKGTRKYVCTRCSATKTVALKVLGHTFSGDYGYCTRCGYMSVKSRTSVNNVQYQIDNSSGKAKSHWGPFGICAQADTNLYTGKIIIVTEKIDNGSNIWYKYDGNKYIYEEYVKKHVCSPICTNVVRYEKYDSTYHTVKNQTRKCSNSSCSNYNQVSYSSPTKAKHNYKDNAGVCRQCGYTYNCTIKERGAYYIITNKQGTAQRNQPYEISGTAPGKYNYNRVVYVIAETVNAVGEKWYKTKDGYWIYSGNTTRAYAVKYNTNGGTNGPSSQYFKTGYSVKISTQKPVKKGYTFVGWSTASNSSTISYKGGEKYSTKKSITLYAVWKKCSHDYSGNYGICKKCGYEYDYASKAVAASGKYVTIKEATLNSKPYYPRTLSEDSFPESKNPSDLQPVPQPSKLPKDTVITVTKKVINADGKTFYRVNGGTERWICSEDISDHYTIKFNANGGTGGPTSKTFKVGSYCTLGSNYPTRSGYTFIGWTTVKGQALGQGSMYTPNNRFVLQKNATLYAVWTKAKASSYGVDKDFSGTVKWKEASEKDKSRTVNITLTRSWFGASNKGYSTNIARFCSDIAMLGYDNKTGVDSYLMQLGFTTLFSNFSATRDQVNTVIAAKTITVKGAKKNLILVGSIGSYKKQWYSNFDPKGKAREPGYYGPGSYSDTHLGFADAQSYAYSQLNYYMTNRIYGLTKDNVIFLFLGHSRGAAAANLLAARVINEGKWLNSSKSNIYAYTFATQNNTCSEDVGNAKYNCIFNIVNPEDFVTHVMLKKWKYGKYGVTYTLPSKSNMADADYVRMLNRFNLKYNQYKADGHPYNPYPEAEGNVKGVINKIASNVPTVDALYSTKRTSYNGEKQSCYEFMKDTLLKFLAEGEMTNVAMALVRGDQFYKDLARFFAEIDTNDINNAIAVNPNIINTIISTKDNIGERFAEAHGMPTYCAYVNSMTKAEMTMQKKSDYGSYADW